MKILIFDLNIKIFFINLIKTSFLIVRITNTTKKCLPYRDHFKGGSNDEK
jgi:hypothetical protein